MDLGKSVGLVTIPAMHASSDSMHACRILVLETSSRRGSTALATPDGVVASSELSGHMRHAGELLPAIDHLLIEQDWKPDSLTDVFVSVGPGSFTGLRVGVTVARTLAWSLGLRVVAVPTLHALARNALAAGQIPDRVAVLLDAKRDQVYAAAFERVEDRYEVSSDAHLAEPGRFLSQCSRPVSVLGEGIAYHREAVDAGGVNVLEEAHWWPKAENVFHAGIALMRAGRFTEVQELLPLYIRRPEAEEKWEKLHGPKGRRKR